VRAANGSRVARRRIRATIDDSFGIDVRALALFRLGLGVVLLSDVLKRVISLEAHYSDAGVLPRASLAAIRPGPGVFRLYVLSGDLWAQALLFTVAGLLAVALIVGLKTRLATLLSLWLLVSVQARNPLVCHTGDSLLAVLTFWALFLPLGATASVDRIVSGRVPPRRVCSFGSAGLLLQIATFYLGAGLLKLKHEIWTSGRAVDLFLDIDMYTNRFGEWVGDNLSGVGPVLTYGTLAVECVGPLVLLLSFGRPYVRTATVLAFIAFHLGIQLMIHIGLFEILSIVAVSVFLPSWFFDRLGARAPEGASTRFDRSQPPQPWARRLREAVAAASLVLVLAAWGANTFGGGPLPLGYLRGLAMHLALTQKWSIFTSIDRQQRGWFLVVGETEAGSRVDVLEGGDLGPIVRPAHFSETYPNHNWRRFWNLMALRTYRPFRVGLAAYLCREWDDQRPSRLRRLAIFHLLEPEKGGPPSRTLLLAHECGSSRRSRGIEGRPRTSRAGTVVVSRPSRGRGRGRAARERHAAPSHAQRVAVEAVGQERERNARGRVGPADLPASAAVAEGLG